MRNFLSALLAVLWGWVGIALLIIGFLVYYVCANSTTAPYTLRQITINGQSVPTESVRQTDIGGAIYEVRLHSGETFYTDIFGRYIIAGNLYENTPSGLIDMTEQHRRQHRLDQLKAFPRESMINYPAKGREVGEVTVFTDTTCAFCQKLHQEIDQLTAAGIAVRYVPFPRAGSHSPSGEQLAQVLCSAQPTKALTMAFQGGQLENDPSSDCLAAVENGYLLGQRFGVQGTPTIVLPDGEMGEGYMPVQQLIQVLRQGVHSPVATQ